MVDLHVISLQAGSVVVNADVLLASSTDKTTAQSKASLLGFTGRFNVRYMDCAVPDGHASCPLSKFAALGGGGIKKLVQTCH